MIKIKKNDDLEDATLPVSSPINKPPIHNNIKNDVDMIDKNVEPILEKKRSDLSSTSEKYETNVSTNIITPTAIITSPTTSSPIVTDLTNNKRKAEEITSEIIITPEIKKQKAEKTVGDNFEENLVCGICQEILYKCVSLIPCLHNFCAGCYAEWCKRSNKCPACRLKVKNVKKKKSCNN